MCTLIKRLYSAFIEFAFRGRVRHLGYSQGVENAEALSK